MRLLGLCPVSASAGTAGGPVFVDWQPARALQEALFDIQIYYRVRDELLATSPQGRQLTDLYDRYGLQIGDVLMTNPALKDQGVALLQHWEPKLQALLDGQGETVGITRDEVDEINRFLDGLESAAGDDLRAALQSERAGFNLSSMADETMSEAWTQVNEQPASTATFTATPANTATPKPGDTTPPQLTVQLFTSPWWNPKGWINVYLLGAAFDSQSGIQSVQITVQDEYGVSQPVVPNIYPKPNRPLWWESTIRLQDSCRPDDKDGRIYTITVTATDNAGNQKIKTLTYVVRRKK